VKRILLLLLGCTLLAIGALLVAGSTPAAAVHRAPHAGSTDRSVYANGLPKPTPVSQFGMSYGPLTDAASTGPDGYVAQLAAEASVTGSNTGSLFRGAFHWTPTSQAGPSFTSKYDPFITQAAADGITVLPEIHTSIVGGGGYIDPLTCTGPGCGTANFEAAVESIALRYGPNGTFTAPGFTGITRYEVWNEPNTPTGHVNTNKGQMPPSEFVPILQAESAALVAAATQNGWLDKLQIACCAFGNSGISGYSYGLQYLKSLVAQTPAVWDYISPTGALPGVITTHQYFKPINPSTCVSTATGGQKCIQYLSTWHHYFTAQGQTAVGLGITEGGYSGADTPPSCNDAARSTSQANQAAWDTWVVNYIHSHPGFDFVFFAPYRVVDDGRSSDCWQSALAPVMGGGAFKAWGTAYKQLITADAP
jgi:hypothetical protein